jgi:hypothetical protein
VPPDPDVERVHARRHERRREGLDLLPRPRLGHQLRPGHPEQHREPVPDRLAHRCRHLDPEPHPPLGVAAPRVIAPVRHRGEELIDEVALRAHHLDRREPELLRQRRPGGELGHHVPDLVLAERPRLHP